MSFSSTGDSLYSAHLGYKVTIKSLDQATTYYTYNSLSDNSAHANPVIYANISLGINHHGSFDIQLYNVNQDLDTDLISAGARVYIELGKSDATYTRILSGMIRGYGYSRLCGSQLLYNLNGYGTGIRLNERITEINNVPSTLLKDGVTIDQNDSEFFADELLDNIIDRAAYYPEDVPSENVEGEGGFEYLDTTTTQADSQIEDFIPGLTNRFEELQDPINRLEEMTLSRIYIDANDKPQMTGMLTPASAAYGFRITNVVDQDNDDGDSTMYIMTDYDFHEHYSKDFGYSNKLYGILSADPVPPNDYFNGVGFYSNKDNEIAQRFTAPTNPNWEIYANIEFVGINNTLAEGSVRSRWRICEDDNGVPRNTNGIIANHYVYPNDGYDTGTGGDQTVHVFGSGDTDLDENKKYWIILSSTNSTATEYVNWYHNGYSSGDVARAAVATSTADDGGTGWTAQPGPLMQIVTRRFKAEPFGITDQKACTRRIEIDSTIPAFPSQIQNKLSAYKYMVAYLANTARGKRVYNFPALTIPNRPVFPGDIAVIQDNTLNLSTSGQPVSCGQITDISYNFGIRNGGVSAESRGPNSLSLSVQGYPNAGY